MTQGYFQRIMVFCDSLITFSGFLHQVERQLVETKRISSLLLAVEVEGVNSTEHQCCTELSIKSLQTIMPTYLPILYKFYWNWGPV